MPETAPPPHIAFGTRVRTSPFFDSTRRYGCKCYSVYNHMFMPVYYDSPVADFWKLVNDVTLWDVAVERQVEITGPDAARFVQRLTPRNLSACAVGQCKYVLITAADGGIVNDPVLLRLGENHFWLSLADSDVLLWARGAALNAGLDVTIAEPDVSPLQIQGPKSTEVVEALFGDWVRELKYYRFREAELDGIPVVLSRTGWSTERGYEVFLRDGRHGDRLWEMIMAAGKPFGIAPGAPSTIRRIEGGLLSYGADMTLDNNPFEIGLERLVDLDQAADFIGKDALRRIKAEGVGQRLVGLEIAGPPLAAPNQAPWPVRAGGEAVGRVTSAVHSPRLEKNLALAYLRVGHDAIGTVLSVALPDGPAEATVAETPFYDPKKALPSSS